MESEKGKQIEKNWILLGLKTQKEEKLMFTLLPVRDLEHWSLLPSQAPAGDLENYLFPTSCNLPVFYLLNHSFLREELPYRGTGHCTIQTYTLRRSLNQPNSLSFF